ncbi:MAG: LacI family DNA-binding transcriptional regulator [Desulfobacteraceae bacterium]|nr:LacI family DNA-binding transcriptional regulator [Desulfobacteraceae bacterium]
MSSIKMKDIAELAGVSATTVSRVFNSPDLVRPGTRDRILQVCKQNHYVYNATAGDLSRKNSTVVGMIVPTTKNPVFGDCIQGVQEKAQELGYSIMMGHSNYDNRAERNLLQRFQERQVAGLILAGFTFGQEKFIRNLMESGIPCIVTSERLDDSSLSYVGYDNLKAAYAVTEYLIGLKHRRIGMIVGPCSKMSRVKKRLEGYKRALKKHGIPYDASLVIEREPTLIDGKEAMGVLLSLPQRPTAVFAASDWLGIGGLSAIKERGLQVPEDVSLAGFDDIDIAAYCDPPLTTIRVPGYEMGRIAMRALSEMIKNGESEVRQYCLETHLVVRESCAEPGNNVANGSE